MGFWYTYPLFLAVVIVGNPLATSLECESRRFLLGAVAALFVVVLLENVLSRTFSGDDEESLFPPEWMRREKSESAKRDGPNVFISAN